jgi:hypothetical protein
MSVLLTSTQGRLPARSAAVGQQLLTAVAPALERADDRQHLRLGQRALPELAALADELERQRAVPPDHDVLLAQRREAVRLVLAGVLLAADAEEAEVEQPHGAGQHPGAAEVRGRLQVGDDPLAGSGEPRGELEDPVVLGQVPLDAPGVVVAVLPAALGVHAGGLDVPVRDRADPHVLPRGRQDELGDPLQDGGVVDGRPAASTYEKPSPARTRAIPGPEQETRRRRTTARPSRS